MHHVTGASLLRACNDRFQPWRSVLARSLVHGSITQTTVICLLRSLSTRMLPAPPQVRSAAVKGLIELVNKDATVLPKALLEAIELRMRDKKVQCPSILLS